MVLTAFSSGARHKGLDWESETQGATSGPAPAVAFTSFADVWPRATETEIGAALCAIGAGKDFDFEDPIVNIR